MEQQQQQQQQQQQRELRQQDINAALGTGRNPQPETVMASQPDMIVVPPALKNQVEMLQQKLGRPLTQQEIDQVVQKKNQLDASKQNQLYQEEAMKRMSGQPDPFQRWAAIGSTSQQAGYTLRNPELFGQLPDSMQNQKMIGYHSGPSPAMSAQIQSNTQTLDMMTNPAFMIQEGEFQQYMDANGPQLWRQLKEKPDFMAMPNDYERNKFALLQMRRRRTSIYNW